MIHLPLRFARSYRLLRGATPLSLACTGALLLAGALHADPIPENLGSGLGKLVASHVAIANAAASGVSLPNTVQFRGQKYTDEQAAGYAKLAITDASGRFMVKVTLNGKAAFDETRRAMEAAISSLTISAVDKTYRGVGVIAAYVNLSEVPALAKIRGVSAVILELKPYHSKINRDQALSAGGPNATVGETLNKLGTCFDQGVTQHRVDQIDRFYNPSAAVDYEGTGMQVGCISDSYAANTTNPPSVDVTNGDLPGSSTDPADNTTPVYVFQDDTTSGNDDEGRAMCQIVHKMAPKAAIAFATADSSEVGFANNIRGLAGIAGYTKNGQTFAADTICDDVGYYGEPYFQDGIIAMGIDAASAAGVCYFSSAANDIGINGYDSPLRWVPDGTGLTAAAGNTALAGTNINLANVPAALYAGGFHNFNPAAGALTVAQLVNIGGASEVPTELQYNEPYDEASPGANGAVVLTRISLLVFNTAGTYLPNSSLTANELSTNEPLQLGYTNAPSGASQVQYVIARANVPTGPDVATEVRYVLPGNGLSGFGPATFFTYNTVTTGGHAMSSTCNGCAAYSAFRPSLPEFYTSPGPVNIYYDENNNRLNPPTVRLQPHIALCDNANISTNMSYFTSDVAQDPDTNPNFAGTSAAGPHAAAIAALVLQAKGGRRSVTPAQMTSLLERSTSAHDLDPNSADGSARVTGGSTGSGKVTITINSDDESNTDTGLNDPNSFAINYIGGSSVTSFVFNPTGSNTTGGDVTEGNNGVTYSTSPTTVGGSVTYFENSLPGVCFLPNTKAFTLGTGVTGATAAYSNLSSGTAQYYTMTITIPAGNLSGGNILHFTVGRGVARGATTGGTYNTVTSATTGTAYYSADIFGGGVILPEGTVTSTGMSFSGTTADGGTFSGTIRNNIGFGYSPTDGYGFVNAQMAVGQSVQ